MFGGPVRSLVAVLATVALLGAGCGWVGAEQEPLEPLVIGVDLQVSGVGGPVDRVLERGLELRVEQVNARDLYGSRPVELTILDNAGDPARSRHNVAALAADRSVSAVITGSCERCWAEAAGPAMTAGVVVVVSLAAYDVLELAEERRWVFRVRPDAADGADVLALELANAQVETVGLLAAVDALWTVRCRRAGRGGGGAWDRAGDHCAAVCRR